MKNIYLIGHMASGKTTIAEKLAADFNKISKDTDAMVIKMFGKPINQIFDEDGEEQFRIFETAALLQTTLSENIIVSTGGGILGRTCNGGYMKKYGTVIYLESDINEQMKRLTPEDIEKRPALRKCGNDPVALRKVLENLHNQRDFLYRYYADLIINTDGKSVQDVIKEIRKFVEDNRMVK